jgi:hypothetical protein
MGYLAGTVEQLTTPVAPRSAMAQTALAMAQQIQGMSAQIAQNQAAAQQASYQFTIPLFAAMDRMMQGIGAPGLTN